jgi:hypothetical protein
MDPRVSRRPSGVDRPSYGAVDSCRVAPVTRDDDLLDLLDELREASMAFEDAYDDCPRGARVTNRRLREAADRLQDIGARYAAARDRNHETSGR